MALGRLHFWAAAVLATAALAAAQGTCVAPTIRLKLSNCSIPATDKNTAVSAWGLLARVGDSAQLCLAPSTAVNSTILMSNEICEAPWLSNPDITPAQCRSRRGGFLQRSDFSSVEIDSDSEMTRLETLNPGWKNLMAISKLNQTFQHALKADLHLSSTRKVNLVEGLAVGGQQSSLSHLGLGEQSELLDALKKANLIGTKSWGLDSGSQSVLHPRDGSLVLGGFDQGAYTGTLWDFVTQENQSNTVQERPCPLQVSVTQLLIKVNKQSSSWGSSTTPIKICIEPYDNLFRLSSEMVDSIVTMANLTGQILKNQANASLFDMEPGLVFPHNRGPVDMSMEITLANGFKVTIPSHELVRPMRGLNNETGELMADPDFDEITVYSANPSTPGTSDPYGIPVGNSAVFGKVFLSQVYLYVNYEAHKFSLGLQSLGNFASAVEPSAPCASEAPQGLSNTDKGLIGGISALGALVLAVILVLSFLVWKKWATPSKAGNQIELHERGQLGVQDDTIIRTPGMGTGQG